MSDDQQDFLRRWSRRKTEAREARAEAAPDAPGLPAPAGPGMPVEARAAPPARELPPLDTLRGAASEYRDFLQSGVDENLRRAALKRLFQDPRFNTMDGLDVYIDDYTKADPIPEAMLKALNQAKGLIFDREEENQVKIPAEQAVEAPPRAEELPGAEASDNAPVQSKAE